MSTRGVQLSGRRVLITGAGSGLGRRLALMAARRGANVLAWDLDGSAAEATATLVQREGGSCSAERVDVTDEPQVQAAAEAAGAVDVLVNNAGVVTGGGLLEAGSSQIRRTFEVNVLAMYWTTQALLPGMLRRDSGMIVNISSAAGLAGVARQTAYSASKHAVVGFTESLRAELRTGGHAVSTFLVCPYYINTGMFDGVRSRFPRLLPILEESTVAAAIVRGIERGRQVYITPPLARIVPLGRLLPVRTYDAVMDFLGINHSMDHFTGRRGQDRTSSGGWS